MEDYKVDYEKGQWVKTGRFFMYLFNTVFFGFGSILFAICLWIRFDPDMDDYVRNIDFMQYWDAVVICMVGSIMVMIASSVAFCGTYFWSKSLLIMYVVLSVVSFSLNLGGAVYLLSIGLESTKAFPFIQREFRNLIYQYSYDMNAKRTVDIIQETIGCCGGYSASDWAEIHMPVPNTCRDQVTGNQYGDSCAEVVSWYLEFRTGWVSGIALCLCFLQLFTLLFAVCIYHGSKERRRIYKEVYQY